MDDMRTLKQIVKDVLTEDRRTRNSDGFLYLRVLEEYGKRNGVDINTISVPHFLLQMKEYGFPPFESVRRNRQLIQTKHRELCADDPVDARRLVREEWMRDYVRSAKCE